MTCITIFIYKINKLHSQNVFLLLSYIKSIRSFGIPSALSFCQFINYIESSFIICLEKLINKYYIEILPYKCFVFKHPSR